ncbi:orf21 protein [Rutstroemia sp. NJR-2017a BVV2]|nr:orf21 protein [Rutstroemia sp. NJR-2017a BVV2]PQE09391.1 orf21 protein [Rutstroemia sp. NJR-2017a BVV2]
MYLKRKRSNSDISTTSSMLTSPLHNGNSMAIDSTAIASPSLLSSRTRKRHRDNRPNEEIVHQHTLSLLYSAQQHQYNSFPTPTTSPTFAPVAPIPAPNQASHQSSLHSFWQLPSARHTSPGSDSSSPSTSANTPALISNNQFFRPTNCEDCDASLSQEDGDGMDVDMMMDVDGAGEVNHACTSCGKAVCHSCAVSNLGMQRKCLGCAGRNARQGGKRWVGGLGWMD